MLRFKFNNDRTVTAVSLDDDGQQEESSVTIGPNGTYHYVNGQITMNSETDHRVDIQVEDGPLLKSILKTDYWVIQNLEGFSQSGSKITGL